MNKPQLKLVEAIKSMLPRATREVSRDEYEDALATSKRYRALMDSDGWKELEKVIRSQMKHRAEMILAPVTTADEVQEQQLIRGERLGLALILRTVPAIIEDAEATLEMWRTQPNGPDSEQPAERTDGPAKFRRSP